MATAAKADPAAKDAPKKKNKLIPIIIAAVVALGGGGGAAWYFLKPKGEDAEHAEEAHPTKKARVFLPIDAFTVNLSDEANRFAQIGMTLELESNVIAEEIKVAMPAVRDRILRLIAGQRSSQLLSAEGKTELAELIAEAVGKEVGWEPPDERPKKKSHGKGKGDDEEDDEAGEKGKAESKHKAKKSKSRKASRPNPVSDVHFTQFIVQ